jgi:hypothetical protein
MSQLTEIILPPNTFISSYYTPPSYKNTTMEPMKHAVSHRCDLDLGGVTPGSASRGSNNEPQRCKFLRQDTLLASCWIFGLWLQCNFDNHRQSVVSWDNTLSILIPSFGYYTALTAIFFCCPSTMFIQIEDLSRRLRSAVVLCMLFVLCLLAVVYLDTRRVVFAVFPLWTNVFFSFLWVWWFLTGK